MKSCQAPKIVFFGTSEFGAIILEKMVQAGLPPVLVVTTPDKPAGRKQELTPPPVKLIAEKFKLPIFQPTSLVNSAIAELTRQKIDIFIVAAYGKILPQTLLDIPQKGSLNVHPSLLPKYRGSSPIQTALLNGEDETGVTIMLMDEKVDHGPIMANAKFQMTNAKITYPELHNQLAELGAQLLIETMLLWVGGKIKPMTQDDSQATYTSIIKKEDGRIDWSKEAVYIERQVRALNPWPGTFTTCEIDGKPRMMKILKASVMPQDRPLGKPGQTFPPPLPGIARYNTVPGIAVQTGKDALFLEEFQMEGGKPMPSRDFLLGHKDFLNTILE